MTKLLLNVFFCYFVIATCTYAAAQKHELANGKIVADFGPSGLISITDGSTGAKPQVLQDSWSVAIDNVVLRSTDIKPSIHPAAGQISYSFKNSDYEIEVIYRLAPGWRFVSKQLSVLHTPQPQYTIHRVTPIVSEFTNGIKDVRVPTSYTPQLGLTIDQTHKSSPAQDYGIFLRPNSEGGEGLMLLVQNPYLQVTHSPHTATLEYDAEMQWNNEWGPFQSDIACIGPYRLAGDALPREMVIEWKTSEGVAPKDGMDRAEIGAFTDCVRAFLIHPQTEPSSVEVGWTLNDYQIDVGTEEGKAEYRRVIDTAAALGIRHLLYAPGNSTLAKRTESADSWSWEYVLWLNLGQKIRKGEWDPAKDTVPADVAQMLAYAKSKHVGLLAYAYPSMPYEKQRDWLVTRQDGGRDYTYATLASRDFQDYLLRNLIAFQRKTGITGYSFDYAWLNLPGSSSYAQWFGWRRVMEGLRRAVPEIVIDGRQSYQQYGPWSWLAGTYPHPTGTDEQPESFKPFPDLHFDRVSADRTRFVNYWYRNYQFAPSEVIPGYATHQTERSVNLPADAASSKPREETVYTRYRPRDWDYLGFRYSFLSSIATGGWNNVVDMIPARDDEEWKHFSDADKRWIREWLEWTVAHKEYLRQTRTILDQPGIGKVDGTAAVLGDRGYLFLFNPNYRRMTADVKLDASAGLTDRGEYVLREVYPQAGRLVGKAGAGVWNRGDSVHVSLDGTSVTVLEIMPTNESKAPTVFNAADEKGHGAPRAKLRNGRLEVSGASGEPGDAAEIGVLLPKQEQVVWMTVNGRSIKFEQKGRYVTALARYAGKPFHQAQAIELKATTDDRLQGEFTVPGRVMKQLAERKKAWPIPWTEDDYETTWLAPERLLMFVQFAEGTDAIEPKAWIDGEPLPLKAAYTSTRVHRPSFVGFYADLSRVSPDQAHHFTIKLDEAARAKLQGVFFDNVEPQWTEELVP